MALTKVCEWCGARYGGRKRRGRRFCSVMCYRQSQISQAAARRRRQTTRPTPPLTRELNLRIRREMQAALDAIARQ